MKVFISWSGERSRHVAVALRQWLPDVIQEVEPWMSQHDIVSGARWSAEIGRHLDSTNFGILCLTPENAHADWLLFEAGALAKKLTDSFVVPYLIAMEPSEIPGGPLSQFQAKRSTKDDTLKLVQDVNAVLGIGALEADRLSRLFERAWPDLETAIKTAPATIAAPKPRSIDDVLSEILETVRSLARTKRKTPDPLTYPPSRTYFKVKEILEQDPDLRGRRFRLGNWSAEGSLQKGTISFDLDGRSYSDVMFEPPAGERTEEAFILAAVQVVRDISYITDMRSSEPTEPPDRELPGSANV
jgi:hypothetical protein